MLAPVFASMIEPSVVSPGGPHSPLATGQLAISVSARPRGGAFWVAHPSVHCKTAAPTRPRCATLPRNHMEIAALRGQSIFAPMARGARLAVGDARHGLVV